MTSCGVVAPKIIAPKPTLTDENCTGEETIQSSVSIENNSNEDTSKNVLIFLKNDIH